MIRSVQRELQVDHHAHGHCLALICAGQELPLHGRPDGFVIEAGPDSFISEKPWALALCASGWLAFAVGQPAGAEAAGGSAAPDKEPRYLGNLFNELPNMRPAYAQVPYVVPEENWPRKGLQIEQILIEARDAILLGQVDAKTGMDRAQAKVEQALR